MNVTVPGPLGLITPKGKGPAPAAGDDPALAAGDAAGTAGRSFADILAAAQPGTEDPATTALPLPGDGGRSDGKGTDKGDEPAADVAAGTALPPWLVPPPMQNVVRDASPAANADDASAAPRDALAALDARATAGRVPLGLATAAANEADVGNIPNGADATRAESARAANDFAAVAAQVAAAATPSASASVSGDLAAPLAQALVAVAPETVRNATPPPAAPGSVPAGRARRDAADAATPEAVSTVAGESAAPATAAAVASAEVRTAPASASAAAQPVAPAPERNARGEEAPRAAFAAPHAPSQANAASAAVATPADKPVTADAAAPAAVTPATGDTPAPAPVAHEARVVERTPTSVTIAIERPVASAGWAQDVSGALAQAITVRHSTAQLHLRPENMGPVDVVIRMAGSEANIQLVVPHAATREALESALPMLRDLLGDQGIALGQAAIESRAQQQDASPSPQQQAAGVRATAAPAGVAAVEDAPASVARVLRLLDVFA
ncbi:MAG: flagellar hook-length control protein FliK [Burkholderiales bacterium]